MDETPENETQSLDSSPTAKPRRKRTGRKRTVFRKVPRPAWPVRGLWEAAPEEERTRAHATCMAILEYWLGKKTKGQVAKDLEVTPLRVWQLSQQALSGMMAGLLPQPRTRVTAEDFEKQPGQAPRVLLTRRITQLEAELARTEDLVRVLRMAPWASPSSDKKGKEESSRARKPAKKRARKKRPEKKNPARDAGAHRPTPPGDESLA